MLKKNYFYILLITIYILYLGKDYFFKIIDNRENINNYVCEVKNINYEEDYQNIIKMLDIPTQDMKVIFSKIIFRDIYEFYDKITITKGKSDGIKVGNVVINEQGVIGVINATNNNSSEVLLITNSKTNLSVKIGNSYGILTSIDDKLIVKNIKLTEKIREGDIVTTSGLTDIPANLYIGKVLKVEQDNLGLEYIITLEKDNNLKNIKYVGVLGL